MNLMLIIDQRDQAWKDLREIREIIKADDNESTVDEVRRLFNRKHISLLEKYSQFLEEHGYIDTDWRDEKPTAIDLFIKEHKL